MGNNSNSPNYKTKYSKIKDFKDFTQNIGSELEELENISRKRTKDHDSDYNLPHVFSQKYNKVTKKYDNESGEEIKSRIESIPKKKSRKKFSIKESNAYLCCDDCTGEKDCVCCDDCQCWIDNNLKSYMFFKNLKTIMRICKEIYETDEEYIDGLLEKGHNWAEDHVSVAKENITHVYNFLSDYFVNESKSNNYMFFANIKTIFNYSKSMVQMDSKEVDEILNNGHDWAEDHISSAKENLIQVNELIKSKI